MSARKQRAPPPAPLHGQRSKNLSTDVTALPIQSRKGAVINLNVTPQEINRSFDPNALLKKDKHLRLSHEKSNSSARNIKSNAEHAKDRTLKPKTSSREVKYYRVVGKSPFNEMQGSAALQSGKRRLNETIKKNHRFIES